MNLLYNTYKIYDIFKTSGFYELLLEVKVRPKKLWNMKTIFGLKL